MPFKENRQYRSIDLSSFDVSGDSYVVEGYATTFNQPYELWEDYYEQVSRSAFDATDMSDVIFQLNHEGIVMARQSNGTLSVHPDDHGLAVRADLSSIESSRELFDAIKAGLITRMSFGFVIADGGWGYDEHTRTSTITSISKVFDVSAVSLPANPETEIHSARSYLDGVIEARKKQELLQRRKVQAAAAARMRLHEIGE